MLNFKSATAVLSLILAILGSVEPAPRFHVYENKFVERSLAIVVRDGELTGEYSIGFNQWTATRALEMMAAEESADPAAGDAESEKLEASESKTNPASSQSPQDSDEDSTGSGEHFTDPDVIEQFNKKRDEWFTNNLKINCGQQRVKLSDVQVKPAPRHPYSMVVEFKVDLVDQVGDKANTTGQESGSGGPQVVDLTIDDQTFGEFGGAVRYALKTRGKSMLLQSNVAPILVRADRQELSGLKSEERRKIQHLKARLTIPRPKS